MKKLLKTRTWLVRTLAASAAFLGCAGSVSAGIVPTFVSETTSGGNSAFLYNINFSTNGSTESLTSGDYFTLYDIGTFGSAPGNYVSFGLNGGFGPGPMGFTGQTPAFTSPPDSPLIRNLTVMYGGPTLTTDSVATLSLTYVGVLSTTTGYYSSTNTIPLGKNSQAGLVTVPLIVVPEPTTCTALALGGALAAAALRRRRAKI